MKNILIDYALLLQNKFNLRTIALVLLPTFGCSSVNAPGGTLTGLVPSGNIQLEYELTLPDGEGPFPAVVLGQGSGNVNKNHRLAIRDANHLMELGFAVMRYDKRGTGGSGGEVVSLSQANSETTIPLLASDMIAVTQRLLTMPEIDPTRLLLFGTSQATWFMPLVADNFPQVRAVVVVTGGTLSVGYKVEFERLTRIEGLSSEAAQNQMESWSGEPGFDPAPFLRSLDIPFLYLLGDRDALSPVRIVKDSIAALHAEGEDISMISYPDGVHALDGTDFWPDLEIWLSDGKV